MHVSSKHNIRQLGALDKKFFNNCQANLNGIIIFGGKGMLGVTSSDSKLKAAFQGVVKRIPILQTVVVGEGDDTVFQNIYHGNDDDHGSPDGRQNDTSALPSLIVDPIITPTESAMMERARSILSDQKLDLAAGGQDAYRRSIRIHAVRSSHSVAFSFIVPHHFSDGAGLVSIFTQLYVLQLLPSFMWRLIMHPRPGSKRMELPPSFDEMVMKRNVPTSYIEDVDIYADDSLCPKFAKENFCFENYDTSSPSAISELRGMSANLAFASAKSMAKTLKKLRKEGLSLTSAFDALAVKVLGRLIADYSADSTGKSHDSSFLLGTTPIDGRNMRKVSKGKQEKHSSKMFPVVGNYAFCHYTQISMEDALKRPLEKIAKIMKKRYQRLQTDETYRLHHIAASIYSPIFRGPFCGTSSVLSSDIIKKLGVDISSEIRIDFGPIPRCWFYVISHGSQTNIAVDVHVPLPNLTRDATRNTILNVSKGTTLEHLFASTTES